MTRPRYCITTACGWRPLSETFVGACFQNLSRSLGRRKSAETRTTFMTARWDAVLKDSCTLFSFLGFLCPTGEDPKQRRPASSSWKSRLLRGVSSLAKMALLAALAYGLLVTAAAGKLRLKLPFMGRAKKQSEPTAPVATSGSLTEREVTSAVFHRRTAPPPPPPPRSLPRSAGAKGMSFVGKYLSRRFQAKPDETPPTTSASIGLDKSASPVQQGVPKKGRRPHLPKFGKNFKAAKPHDDARMMPEPSGTQQVMPGISRDQEDTAPAHEPSATVTGPAGFSAGLLVGLMSATSWGSRKALPTRLPKTQLLEGHVHALLLEGRERKEPAQRIILFLVNS